MDQLVTRDNPLGIYLKDRRSKLDPDAFGMARNRRRVPGLRREEVAQRANISTTWYTWLEQGRGGAPSAVVLEGLARALMLSDLEREHLFLLGLGRLPDVRYKQHEGVSPTLQRVLDALNPSPACVKTATWDVVAWNSAAAFLFTDFGSLPPPQRNILRRLFLDPDVRAAQGEWDSVARFVVGAFRVDAARAGAAAAVQPLVDELCRFSSDFRAMWQDNDLRSHGEGFKRIQHPVCGCLTLEYSAFAVDNRPDLSMIVYNSVVPEEAARIRLALEATSRSRVKSGTGRAASSARKA